eukprot:5633862-Alexandrium_andersonii.AAC.1
MWAASCAPARSQCGRVRPYAAHRAAPLPSAVACRYVGAPRRFPSGVESSDAQPLGCLLYTSDAADDM